MRVRTELSEMPPVYSVVNENGMAVIRFYTDVQAEQREDDTVYTATMLEMTCPWQSTLSQRIENNPELWLTKINANTAAEEATKRLDELKSTAVYDAITELGEIVATLAEAVGEIGGMLGG